jgi:hypothetical protein
MPNFDGGHYFYTGLCPINRTAVPRKDGTMAAPSHIVREALETLPNFSQVPGSSRTSPFARSETTHFARIAVIDDPAFNGRNPADAIKQALTGVNLLEHEPIDYLSRPWLLFGADFDAADGKDSTRDAWAEDLWDHMSSELQAVFGHCTKFDEVKNGKDFAAYLARAQIETTMSFNDYYIDKLSLPTLSMGRLLATLAVPVALAMLGAWLIDRETRVGWWLWLVAGLLGLGIGIWAAYRLIMSRGARPFPPAPNNEGRLETVLKGLYLQQRFSQFATDHQFDTPEQLHAAFGTFLADHDPANSKKPTQPPGVLNS